MLQKLTYSLHGVMLTNTQLKELGLTALGHRMKLRDYCRNGKTSVVTRMKGKKSLKNRDHLLEEAQG